MDLRARTVYARRKSSTASVVWISFGISPNGVGRETKIGRQHRTVFSVVGGGMAKIDPSETRFSVRFGPNGDRVTAASVTVDFANPQFPDKQLESFDGHRISTETRSLVGGSVRRERSKVKIFDFVAEIYAHLTLHLSRKPCYLGMFFFLNWYRVYKPFSDRRKRENTFVRQNWTVNGALA